jgi:hypothetical protein
MTLLTIAQAVARHTALEVPATASGSTDRAIINVVQFINDAGSEAARRFDWGALRLTTTVTGTGVNANFSLPSGFARLVMGNAVTFNGNPVRGGLSADEWASLTPVEGVPRFFRLLGSAISFYPFLANGAVVNVTYQTNFWCSNGSAAFTLDSQTALIPESILEKGAIWRQRRHVGQDFADHMAECEAEMTDRIAFDMRDRSP